MDHQVRPIRQTQRAVALPHRHLHQSLRRARAVTEGERAVGPELHVVHNHRTSLPARFVGPGASRATTAAPGDGWRTGGKPESYRMYRMTSGRMVGTRGDRRGPWAEVWIRYIGAGPEAGCDIFHPVEWLCCIHQSGSRRM